MSLQGCCYYLNFKKENLCSQKLNALPKISHLIGDGTEIHKHIGHAQLRSSFFPQHLTFHSNNNPVKKVKDVSAFFHIINKETGA